MTVTTVVAAILAVFVAAVLLEWLWNITCPEVFGLSKITYWQAYRILLIAGLLLGSWHSLLGAAQSAPWK